MKKLALKNPLKSLPKRKRIPIILAAVIIIAIAGVVVKIKLIDGKSAESELQTATATIRDLSTTITGSGSIISSNLTTVSFKASGTITKLNFKEGETIKKGQVLCTMDTTDINDTVRNAKTNLRDIQDTLSESREKYSELNAKAPISGQIMNLSVNEGDTVQQNGVLFTIIDTSKMKLTVPFNGANISKIKVGDKLSVNLQDTMQTVAGKVVYKSNASYSTATNGNLYNVEIEIVNPGSVLEGTKASAEIEKSGMSMTSADTGALSYVIKKVVKSKAGGTVDKINVRLYQRVNAGSECIIMSNDDLKDTIDSTEQRLQDAKEQLKDATDQLGYYTIKAPIAGIATTMDYKIGDTVKVADTLTTITDNSKMEFEVTVDELDIAKVKKGQKVNVTLDAITQTSSTPLVGEVSNVSIQGSSSNGVTTYPVTIKITGVSTGTIGTNRSNNGFGGFGRRNRTTPSGISNGNFPTRTSDNNGGNYQTRAYGNNNGNFPTPSSGSGTSNSQTRSFNRNGASSYIFGNRQAAAKELLGQLKDGMNANAEIIISENPSVLTVPLEAIMKIGNTSYVMIQSDEKNIAELKNSGKYIDLLNADTTGTSGESNNKSSSDKNANTSSSNTASAGTFMSSALKKLKENADYYKNTIPTIVQIGVSNDTYVQITSGLEKDQIVLLPPVTTSSENSSSSGSSRSIFGGGGIMGGAPQDQQQSTNRSFNRNSSSGSSNRSGGGN